MRLYDLPKYDTKRISKRASPEHRKEELRRPTVNCREVGPLIRRLEYALRDGPGLRVLACFYACGALLHVQRRAEHLVDPDVLGHALNHLVAVIATAVDDAEAPPERHLGPCLHADPDLADELGGVEGDGGAGHLV